MSYTEEGIEKLKDYVIDMTIDDGGLRDPEKLDETYLNYEQVSEALWNCKGNLIMAAKVLHTTRQLLDKFINKNEKLKETLLNIRRYCKDVRVDVLEDQAMRNAMSGEGNMVRYLLNAYGQDRGYGETKKTTDEAPASVLALINAMKELRGGNDSRDEVESKAAICS